MRITVIVIYLHKQICKILKIYTNILFVLTNISSLKILQQKIGIQIKNCPNVYIDRENIFDVHTDNSFYPCIARIENGKIVEHEFQSPKNGAAFYNLRSLLLEQKQTTNSN